MKEAVSLLVGNNNQAIESHLPIHLQEIQEISSNVRCFNETLIKIIE